MRNLFILGIVLTMLSPLGYLLLQEYSYVTYTFTGYYQSRAFDISFEAPEFNFWVTEILSESPRKIEFIYNLREGEVGYDLDDSFGPVTVRKADRTNPLTRDELENMHELKGGDLLYSTPVVEDNGDFANILIKYEELPGFYTLRAPVNFNAPCGLNDAKTVVATILTTIAPAKNYSSYMSAVTTFNMLWNRSKIDNWPNQTTSCF